MINYLIKVFCKLMSIILKFADANQLAAPQNPPEPMFVSVPPRPQRLLHSEAYIRYIEQYSFFK